MAPDCKSGARRRYAGSNPALPTRTRALHSGNASAFQAEVASSILAARSIKCCRSSVVEHFLGKEKAAGSIPAGSFRSLCIMGRRALAAGPNRAYDSRTRV
jgi:hypothetical protein